MKTMWVVKHNLSGAYLTVPKANPTTAWEEFWYHVERKGQMNKIDDTEYVAVAISIVETGAVCTNEEW